MTNAPTNLPPNAPEKKESPQARWMKKQVALGNCRNCGKPRADSPYAIFCRRCAALNRVRVGDKTARGKISRAKRKHKGKAPYDVPVTTRAEIDRLFPKAPVSRKRKPITDDPAGGVQD